MIANVPYCSIAIHSTFFSTAAFTELSRAPNEPNYKGGLFNMFLQLIALIVLNFSNFNIPNEQLDNIRPCGPLSCITTTQSDRELEEWK